MNAAFKPFEQYIQYLTEGKLDPYLDSTRRDDKITLPGLGGSTDPFLLLHNLGNHPEEDRIQKLFIDGTMFVFHPDCVTAVDHVHSFLFNTSGAGKTRLSLEGLCRHWGIYLTCQAAPRAPSGSGDFAAAVAIMESSTWDETGCNIQQNASATDRVFAMFLCARLFVLKRLLDLVPLQTDVKAVKAARRRWVLLQIFPPCLRSSDDVFVEILRSIRSADIDIMQDFIRTTINDLFVKKDILSEEGKNSMKAPLFLVIDEAHEAYQFNGRFRSDTTGDYRPILHQIFKYFQGISIFRGIIVVGTGLSAGMVTRTIRSVSAGTTGRLEEPVVFSDVGAFTRTGSSQDAYVRQYLTLLDNLSDQRLMERIQYWFCGRFVHWTG